MSKYLVTTALEETWPEKKDNVLFLGEWCKIYSRKHTWSKYEHEVVPYHWDDRDKLHSDYLYLESLYEILLTEFSGILNKFHDVNKTKRYWRILIGYWLGWFLHIIYDRWFSLNYVSKNHDNLNCIILENDSIKKIHNSTSEFCVKAPYDNWNEYLFSYLIINFFSERFKIKKVSRKSKSCSKHTKRKSNYLKKKFIYLIENYNRITQRENEYFFKHTYLPKIVDLKLQIKLGQIPKIRFGRDIPKCNASEYIRKDLLHVDNPSNDRFYNVARKILLEHLPSIFLEGYRDAVTEVKKSCWPKNPKAIFASNSFHDEDYFKLWVGEKIEQKIPLYIGQHGGNFGMSKFAFHDKYQFGICDRWLSWGWESPHEKKVVPVGNLKNYMGKVKYTPSCDALLILMDLPRYSYYLYSCPISSTQVKSYLDDQLKFLDSLPGHILGNFKVRPHHIDFGHNAKSLILDHFEDIRFDSGKYKNSIQKSKLIVSTYNATTYLETLNWNIPTICFWNPKHWEMNDESQVFFNELIEVGILHDDPESAAQKVEEIWDDVDCWWNSKKVQTVRDRFCNNFSRNADNLGEIISILKN